MVASIREDGYKNQKPQTSEESKRAKQALYNNQTKAISLSEVFLSQKGAPEATYECIRRPKEAL